MTICQGICICEHQLNTVLLFPSLIVTEGKKQRVKETHGEKHREGRREKRRKKEEKEKEEVE